MKNSSFKKTYKYKILLAKAHIDMKNSSFKKTYKYKILLAKAHLDMKIIF